MNLRYGMFLAVWAALTALGAAELRAEERVHTVARGETFYSIARTYGVTVDELMRYNGVTDPQKLIVGRRIKIPGGGSSPAGGGVSASRGMAEYRAVKGDTLYGIARRYGITLQSLLSANDLSIRYVLKEGDRLKIPLSPAEEPKPVSPILQPSPALSVSPALPMSPALSTSPAVPVNSAAARPTSRGELDPSLRWPVAAKELSYMTGKLYGVVLLGERSESVRNLIGGTVVSAGPYRGFGRVAIVQAAGGYLYVYGGCESLSVKEGDRVVPGTELGRLGLDAVSDRPNLFFMVYRSSTPIDPAKAPRA